MNSLFLRSIHTKLTLSFLLVAVIPLLLLVCVDEQITENTLTKHLMLLFVCIGIIIPVIAFIIGQSLTKPLTVITNSVEQFSAGNFDQHIQVNSSDETAQLAQSINQMAQQLKETFEILEQRVREREAELQIAKETARTATQLKNTFIDNIGHDLRSPLNAVLGFSEIMLHTKNLSAEHYENVRIIHNSGEHLLNLINTLIARTNENNPAILLKPQDLNVMSVAWLNQLYDATLEADSQKVITLIKEIPSTETALITQLTQLVTHFQFEHILDLIEPLINSNHESC